MRLAAMEAPKYHIVAFDQEMQHFSHLVHTGGYSYRFTSSNGGYTPSGNETVGCTVESSGEPAQVAGGLLNGLTISQLSQQARGHTIPEKSESYSHASRARPPARSSASVVTRASWWWS